MCNESLLKGVKDLGAQVTFFLSHLRRTVVWDNGEVVMLGCAGK